VDKLIGFTGCTGLRGIDRTGEIEEQEQVFGALHCGTDVVTPQIYSDPILLIPPILRIL
jgi:hypothetical protein